MQGAPGGLSLPHLGSGVCGCSQVGLLACRVGARGVFLAPRNACVGGPAPGAQATTRDSGAVRGEGGGRCVLYAPWKTITMRIARGKAHWSPGSRSAQPTFGGGWVGYGCPPRVRGQRWTGKDRPALGAGEAKTGVFSGRGCGCRQNQAAGGRAWGPSTCRAGRARCPVSAPDHPAPAPSPDLQPPPTGLPLLGDFEA